MDDFEKILNESEQEGIKVSQGLSKMLLSMWSAAREDLRAATKASNRLRIVAVVSSVLAVICILVCVYLGVTVNRQAGEIKSINDILSSGVVIEETTTTTTEEVVTQSVDGDSATINNGSWEQYNDNSVNNGGDD